MKIKFCKTVLLKTALFALSLTLLFGQNIFPFVAIPFAPAAAQAIPTAVATATSAIGVISLFLKNLFSKNKTKSYFYSPQQKIKDSKVTAKNLSYKGTKIINHGGYTIIKPKNMSLKKCLALHNIPINPNKAREQYIREKELAEKRKCEKQKSKNHSKGGSQSKSCSNSPKPEDPNNDKKERKVNTVTRTEFFKKVKNDYKFFRNSKKGPIYKRQPGTKGLGKKAEYIYWDHQHNDVEAFSKSKKHIGSYDPASLELYKPPVIGRPFPK